MNLRQTSPADGALGPRITVAIGAAGMLIVVGLAGCQSLLDRIGPAAAQIEPKLAAACADALAIANIAGLVPGVGAIVPYITAGCATADGIARLAADPSSTQWLGVLMGEIKANATLVGIKL